MARYGPPFCEDAPGRPPGERLKRCCRVIAHEIGHIAGLAHCVYFRCLMNGSSSLAESDRRPLHLCPIDLRKLQWLVGFDVAERYASLHGFWRAAGEDPEAAWAEQRSSGGERPPARDAGPVQSVTTLTGIVRGNRAFALGRPIARTRATRRPTASDQPNMRWTGMPPGSR